MVVGAFSRCRGNPPPVPPSLLPVSGAGLRASSSWRGVSLGLDCPDPVLGVSHLRGVCAPRCVSHPTLRGDECQGVSCDISQGGRRGERHRCAAAAGPARAPEAACPAREGTGAGRPAGPKPSDLAPVKQSEGGLRPAPHGPHYALGATGRSLHGFVCARSPATGLHPCSGRGSRCSPSSQTPHPALQRSPQAPPNAVTLLQTLPPPGSQAPPTETRRSGVGGCAGLRQVPGGAQLSRAWAVPACNGRKCVLTIALFCLNMGMFY